MKHDRLYIGFATHGPGAKRWANVFRYCSAYGGAAATPLSADKAARDSHFRIPSVFFRIDARFGYRPFPRILRQAIRSTRMRGSCCNNSTKASPLRLLRACNNKLAR